MGICTDLTTARILAEFTDEIGVHRGVVTDTFDDGRRLFVRSVLPQLDFVRSGDKVQGGVALRATDQGLCVHPYVFRQVCTNGSISAQTLGRRQLDELEYLQPDEILRSLREAVASCCAPEVFDDSVQKMRIATRSDADLAISLMPLLSKLGGPSATGTLSMIMENFLGDGDRSRYGLFNAVTATARDTRDPELRWNLEEFGGGILVDASPAGSPQHPLTAASPSCHVACLSVYRGLREGAEMLTLKPASLTAANWMAELYEHKASLIRQPDHPGAWQWRMRVRILSYLVSRYGNDPNLGQRTEPDPTDISHLTFATQERNTKLVRSGTVIRKALSRVAEANKSKLACIV